MSRRHSYIFEAPLLSEQPVHITIPAYWRNIELHVTARLSIRVDYDEDKERMNQVEAEYLVQNSRREQ